MHAQQHVMTAPGARRMIAAQMPDLAHLPLRRIGHSGTDTVLYRLGRSHVARFPRLPEAAAQITHMARWLPQVLPGLTLPTPGLPRLGQPDPGYPYPWSVTEWLPGRDAFAAPPAHAAPDLARFLQALHSRPTQADAPPYATTTLHQRLAALDPFVAQFGPDATTLRRFVAQALDLPAFDGPPVWVHGDLHALNLLSRNGRLSAVIDWGSVGLGDPGMDYMVAWTVLDAEDRRALRDLLDPDPAAWARGRAQAFAKAVMAIPYYRESNPVFRDAMQLTLVRVLDDWRGG